LPPWIVDGASELIAKIHDDPDASLQPTSLGLPEGQPPLRTRRRWWPWERRRRRR
jgi:hypothetical protein